MEDCKGASSYIWVNTVHVLSCFSC